MVHGPGHRNLPEKTKVMDGKKLKQNELPIATISKDGRWGISSVSLLKNGLVFLRVRRNLTPSHGIS
jgi:hypothetical protein